jgi:ubiquinone/menaquinone biosynthesis C-methylase UbiE
VYPNVEYRLGALATLGLAEASYDAVFVHFVLHDIPAGERSGVVAQVSRILRHGGCVYLHEPLGRGLTPDEARALMQAAGLREVSSCLAQSRLAGPTYQAVFAKSA